MSLDSSEYCLKEINELCKINSSSYSKKENWEFINYLDTKNIIKGEINEIKFLDPEIDKVPSRAKRKVNIDDIIISTVRPNQEHYGIIKKEFDNFLVSTGFTTLTVDTSQAVPEFIYYYITQPHITQSLQTIAEQSTTSYPSVKPSDIGNLIVELPSLDIQNKIANMLTSIENKININKEINRNLQNLIKILYKEYFESFELDNVPDDWELVNIGSIIDIYNGYSYKGAELQESDCGMVTIKNFNRDGSFRIDGFKEIVYSNKIKKHHFINENDVLISCTDVTQDADIIGNCIMVLDKQNYDELIMSMDLVKIESKIPEINNFLLASIFKSYNFKKHILGYVNGTTVLHLDKKGIKKFKIALPKDLSELKNISERFELIYAEIQCNQKEINKLTNLRDTLLPKLMSGEIDVSQIDM